MALLFHSNGQRAARLFRSLLTAALLTAALLTPFLVSECALAARLEESGFVYPIMAAELSSKFGPRHHPVFKARRHHSGIDLAAPKGTPIRSIAAGTVVFADPYKGYGSLIVVEHADGLTSHYGHCSKILVAIGMQVRAGEVIGEVGSTGVATGSHLHLELRRNGIPLNPEQHMPGLTIEPQG